MYKWFGIDYERTISPKVTLGASGSLQTISGVEYTRVTFITHYYPQHSAPAGFYIGAVAGFHRARHAHAFGAGMDVG